MNCRFRVVTQWRGCAAALGLAFLALNRPELARVSPLWKIAHWSGSEVVALDAGLYRVPVSKTGVSSEPDGRDLFFRSGDVRYDYRKSTLALKAEPGPGFALTQKSLWFRDDSLERSGSHGREFLLGIRRVGGLPGRLLEWLTLLLLPLVIFPGIWRLIAVRRENLPATPGHHACPEIDQFLDAVLLWLTVIPGAILLVGYSLSWSGLLDRPQAWALGLVMLAMLLGCGAKFLKRVRPGNSPGIPRGLAGSLMREVRNEFSAAPLRGSLALSLFSALLLVQVAQVTIAVFLAPTNNDSLTYILPRLASYLQQGSLDYFDSNFVAMTVHFKNATLLQIFAYVASGRMENATQLIALGASWTALIGIFGISRILTGRILPALGAASVAGLTTNFIMIAVTPQLDMPLTGFVAVTLYFLGRWLQSPERFLPPVVAAFSFCMALGSKATALLLVPSLGIVVLLCLSRSGWRPFRAPARPWILFAAAGILGLFLFVLPAGYAENWRRYGDIMGPERWRRIHVMPPTSSADFFREGLRNTARYGIHFVGLDGLPYSRLTLEVQEKMKEPVMAIANFAGLSLEEKGAARQPFIPNAYAAPNEDMSFAGPAFILLLIPGVLAAFWRLPDRGLVGALVAGAVIYFLAQSFLSRYDPWRGRSFVNLTVLLGPLAASLFCPGPSHAGCLARTGGNVALVLACLVTVGAGLNSGFFRHSSPLYSRPGTITFEGSLLGQHDRLWQLCRSNPQVLDRFRRLESMVPDRAVMALRDVSADLHYPIFGEKLARRVIYLQAGQVPPAGSHLLFSSPQSAPLERDLPLDVLREIPDKTARLFLRKP